MVYGALRLVENGMLSALRSPQGKPAWSVWQGRSSCHVRAKFWKRRMCPLARITDLTVRRRSPYNAS
jgi:hypothetical protein